jgi:hypothetical protein
MGTPAIGPLAEVSVVATVMPCPAVTARWAAAVSVAGPAVVVGVGVGVGVGNGDGAVPVGVGVGVGVGDVDGASGVTGVDDAEYAPEPTLLIAATRKTYDVPLVSPTTDCVVAALVWKALDAATQIPPLLGEYCTS